MIRCGVDEREADNRLKRVSPSRAVRRPTLGMGDAIKAEVSAIRRQKRAVGGIGRAWAAVLPDVLAEHVESIKVSRGTLTVRSTNAAGRYELDRWLRSGGRTALIEAATTTVRKVRVE